MPSVGTLLKKSTVSVLFICGLTRSLKYGAGFGLIAVISGLTQCLSVLQRGCIRTGLHHRSNLCCRYNLFTFEIRDQQVQNHYMLTSQFSVKTNKQNVSSLFENPSELGLWIILRARVFIFFLLHFFFSLLFYLPWYVKLTLSLSLLLNSVFIIILYLLLNTISAGVEKRKLSYTLNMI